MLVKRWPLHHGVARLYAPQKFGCWGRPIGNYLGGVLGQHFVIECLTDFTDLGVVRWVGLCAPRLAGAEFGDVGRVFARQSRAHGTPLFGHCHQFFS